ncbi:hypothetical protein [Mycobacterium sp. AT1]|uniref:hypothetical protein n=1 Tax=Mycobacterium sp. AT1 TaxID=1961706 RepID=UPI001E3B1AC0|nr:hypothetical protein [Mycobacterium sp. AT1]
MHQSQEDISEDYFVARVELGVSQTTYMIRNHRGRRRYHHRAKIVVSTLGSISTVSCEGTHDDSVTSSRIQHFSEGANKFFIE